MISKATISYKIESEHPGLWRKNKQNIVFGILILSLFLLLFLNMGMGAVPLSPRMVLSILLSPLGLPDFHSPSEIQETIVWAIRLPRILMGMLIGGCLGVSGAALQGLFRNPLADPGLVGVSSGAALGAVLVTFWSHSLPSWIGADALTYLLPCSAFGCGVAATFLVYRLATRGGFTDMPMMLLSGVAVNAIVSACIGLLIYASDDQQMRSITFWMFGSLGGARWESLFPALPFLVTPLIAAHFWGKSLNIYLLGEREAGHIGIPVQRLKTGIILFVSLGVGAAVSLSGMIGFVGLAAPHLLRLIVSPDHRFLLPASALLGGVLLLVSDLISRTLAAPAEIPIGLITSFLGGPFFLFLLTRHQPRIGG